MVVLGATLAIVQQDIKKNLAYFPLSQLCDVSSDLIEPLYFI